MVMHQSDAPFGLVALVVFLKTLPAACALSFAAGFAIGLWRRVKPSKRVASYDWLAIIVPFAAGLFGLLTMLAYDKSVFARVIPVRLWLLASMGVFLVLPLVAVFSRARMLRGLDEDPEVIPMAILEARARTRSRWVFAALIAFLLYMAFARPFDFPTRHAMQAIASRWVPQFVTFAIFGYFVRNRFYPNQVDADLTARTHQLASRVGVQVREVRLITSGWAKKNANGFAVLKKGMIFVTQRAADALPPPQLDWLLAHELAHFGQLPVWRRTTRLAVALPAAVALVSLVPILLDARAHSVLALWLIGLPWIGFLVVANEVGEIRRAMEYESDRQAMIAVGDVDVACSAMLAIASNTENPKAHDQELDEHPKLIKRIKAMRMAAAELGLEPAPARQDS